MTTKTRFKVCCIASIAEMQLAVAAGASAVGLVTAMPSGPGPIADELATEIAIATPPAVATFLLTSLTLPEAIVEQVRRCRTNVVQLCDAVPRDAYALLHAELPAVKIVQVVHVVDASAIDEARSLAGEVDAILLDSGRPAAAIKELGGTGRRHDWAISGRIVETCGKPVWLAGGLNACNVAEAVGMVKPFGVDVCSGLRTGGKLDAEKLRAFSAAILSDERTLVG